MASLQNPANIIQPRYVEYTYSLAIGEEINIGSDATFIACLDATADFKIGFDGGPKTTFKKGLTYHPPIEVRSVQIENNSGSANTVTLGLGKGDIRDSRLVLSGGVATQPAATSFTDGGAISALATANTLLLASNAARKEALIYNNGGAAIYVRGDATAAPGGVKLAAGGTLVLETTAAIYAYNAAVSAVSVLVSELVVM